jgi:hypothetical protein
MDILIDSVNKLETILENSGCEEVGVILDVNPDAVNCQFDRGACMTASFGGRSAEFVTKDPIRAQTKISFMFGTPLDTPTVRSAACAMINVATGFFCLSRVLHACPSSRHADCMRELGIAIKGKRVLCIGSMPAIENAVPGLIVTCHKDADLVLINADGIIDSKLGNLIEEIKDTKRIICIGPSTAGVARLQQIEHWCPYGKSV